MKDRSTHSSHNPKDVQSGSALVSILFGIFFLGLSVLLIIDGIKIMMKDRVQIEYLASRAALKRQLISAVDCQLFKPCSPNEDVFVFDSDGQILIKADASTRFRSLRVRAVCSQSSIVEIKAMPWIESRTSGDPRPGKTLDWSDQNLLLVDTSQICPDLPRTDVGPVQVLNGPRCEAKNGTCLPPFPNETSTTMCCTDGRNSLKPKCPNKTREIGAYWDRINDLGMDGAWVVFCQ